MFNTSQTCEQIQTALAAAQAEFPPIPKNKEAEVRNKEGRCLYKFKYADLPQIIESTRPALAKFKIGFMQGFVKTPDGWCVVTRFIMGGEWIEAGFVPVWFSGNDMKVVASTLTYAKRYSLQAALGVAADEDIDLPHEDHSIEVKPTAPPRPLNAAPGARNPQPGTIVYATPTELDRLMESFAKLGVSARSVCRRYKIETLEKLTFDDLEDARAAGRAIVAKQKRVSDYFKE